MGWGKLWKELSGFHLVSQALPKGETFGHLLGPWFLASAAEICQESTPLLCWVAAHGQVSGKHSQEVRDLDLNPYRSWSTCYLDPLLWVTRHFRISGSVSPLQCAMNQECKKQPLLCYYATGCRLPLPETLNLAHSDGNCLPNHISFKRTIPVLLFS